MATPPPISPAQPLASGPPYYTIPPPYPVPSVLNPSIERPALRHLRLAAALSIVGLAIGVAAPQVLNAFTGAPTAFSSFSYTGGAASANNSTVSLPLNTLWTSLALTSVGWAFGIPAVLLFRDAFVRWRGADRASFGTPATLSILLVIGIVLVIVGSVVVISSLAAVSTCVPTGHPVPLHCFTDHFAGILGGALLAVVGALLVLVGGIGVILGLWRAGSRFNDGNMKAAAILFIFPLLNIVAAILLLYRAQQLLDGLPPEAAGPMTYPPQSFPPS